MPFHCRPVGPCDTADHAFSLQICEPTEQQIEQAMQLVDKLPWEFVLGYPANPNIQRQHAVLEVRHAQQGQRHALPKAISQHTEQLSAKGGTRL